MAFLIILTVTLDSFSHEIMSITRVIRRDGVIYFFAIFSSNLVWFILMLDGRVGTPFVEILSALTHGFSLARTKVHEQPVSDLTTSL